jgi:toxin ParE1/3/4
VDVRVLWSAEALEELEGIELHIAQYSVNAADRLSDAILQRAERLVNFSLRGRVVQEFEEKRLRESIVRGYRLIYQVVPDGIEVIAVVHGSRDLTQ